MIRESSPPHVLRRARRACCAECVCCALRGQHETLPSLDVEFRKQDEASREREAAYRRKKEEEEERKHKREEEAAAEKKRKQEESAADGENTENLHPNRRRRSRR
jgi:hypothetical protein